MGRSQPEIETMALTEARQQLSQVVNKVTCGERRVLIEKNGVPVAAIVSVGDLRLLIELEAQREARFAAIQRISGAFVEVPLDELEQQVAGALSEAR
jgi:prevent-host-death family protein